MSHLILSAPNPDSNYFSPAKRLRKKPQSAVSRTPPSVVHSPLTLHISRRLSKVHEHRYSLTRKLRTRTKKLAPPQLDPELVSTVVDKYILPMFEADLKPTLKMRSKSPCEYNGQVYQDLKLSQEFAHKNFELQQDIKESQQKVTEAAQKVAFFEKQAEFYKEEWEKTRHLLQNLEFHYASTVRELKTESELGAFAIAQSDSYKDQFQLLLSENKQLKEELLEVRAQCDKVGNHAHQLQFENSVLRMTNDIIGERLKGLQESSMELVQNEFLEHKLILEFKRFAHSSKALAENFLTNEKALRKKDFKKRFYLQYSRALREVWNTKARQYDKALERYRKEVLELEFRLKTFTEINASLKEKNAESTKKMQTLAIEYESLKQRLRQYTKSNQEDEALCRYCFKSYHESNNFNWSCKRHTSTFTNNLYFCCGKNFKDSPGCVQTRHEPKEDFMLNESENSKSLFCSSCKGLGHSPEDCPKDPNIRSKYTAQLEDARITKALDSKKKIENTSHQATIQKRMIDLLETPASEAAESDIHIQDLDE